MKTSSFLFSILTILLSFSVKAESHRPSDRTLASCKGTEGNIFTAKLTTLQWGHQETSMEITLKPSMQSFWFLLAPRILSLNEISGSYAYPRVGIADPARSLAYSEDSLMGRLVIGIQALDSESKKFKVFGHLKVTEAGDEQVSGPELEFEDVLECQAE